ncbi:hypothetical protein [Methanobrevibacter sp. V14]|uniref:hypothetical protein n=1 Tax=Methanobrevibacter sp. V14 TaxID=3064280 RepID=UPI0027338C79|nr:hypothetical protein [Methanobrevibacter sp. V14]
MSATIPDFKINLMMKIIVNFKVLVKIQKELKHPFKFIYHSSKLFDGDCLSEDVKNILEKYY